jgi:hypothetical protein
MLKKNMIRGGKNQAVGSVTTGYAGCGYRKLSPSWKRENLVCMPTLSAGETDRGNHSVAIQRRSESQSGECKGQSGVSSRRDCFGS